jgi:hypothetical protein
MLAQNQRGAKWRAEDHAIKTNTILSTVSGRFAP